jgi:hypothetical protein
MTHPNKPPRNDRLRDALAWLYSVAEVSDANYGAVSNAAMVLYGDLKNLNLNKDN